MIPVERSREFYMKAKKETYELLGEHQMVMVRNNLQIPNFLRIDDRKMRIWILMIDRRTTKMGNALEWTSEGEFQAHILRAPLMIRETVGDKMLEINTSWILRDNVFTNLIWSLKRKSILLIEHRRPLEVGERPSDDESLLESANVVYTPTAEDFKKKWSFIREPLSHPNIQDRIIFMDCECTAQSENKARKAPLSVTMMDYRGIVLLNKRITPRARIYDFGERFHGITEMMSRNQEDEYETIRRVQRMVKGKILVGHDLTMELNSFQIPKYQLMGIRDFANGKVFQSMGIQKKGSGQWYSLQLLADKVCGIAIQQGKHTSLEDTKAVREIYLKVEKDWVDDVNIREIMAPRLNKSKISLQQYYDKQQQLPEPNNKRWKIVEQIFPTDIDEEDENVDCEIIGVIEEEKEKMDAWIESPECLIMEEMTVEEMDKLVVEI